jgi:hypothetical protein
MIMTGKAALAGLLASYTRLAGIPAPVPDAQGVAALSFDDRLVLHFAPDSDADAAVLYVPLGDPLPDSDDAGVERQMLQANLLGDTTGGGALAFDEREGRPVLVHRTRLSGMSAAEFGQLVARLVDAAEVWSDRLDAARAGGGRHPGERSVPPPRQDAAGMHALRV